ncbi:MAG TPA: Rieske 2Fe-2S domain-containing protein [Myxococcota bacterium]|jgi:phenylpropionate dioxygenase-like ring-hydroxylating dioxygenase large terminal subunit|nr:Rieske 2Fe-2S domain-containing protein [Myxococcota bacterium]
MDVAERIPLPPFPNGWFKLCYSDELGEKGVLPVSVAGRELVVFRGEDGKTRALDAYCPHLGAHLGVGGRVVENTVRCPFHGWRWSGDDGKCVEVPYAKRIPAKAETGCWRVLEQNGFVISWFHAEGKPAEWTPDVIPEVGHPDYSLFGRRRWQLTAHLQELYENGFDVAHFKTLHGMEVKGVNLTADGPIMKLHLEFARDAANQSSAEGMATIRSFMFGPGLSLTRVSGLIEGVSVQSLTPLEPGKMELTHNYYLHKDSNREVAEGFFDFYAKDWELDMPLWNTKVFRPAPVLAEGDGDISRFRKWYRQFYSQPVEVAF